MERGIHNPKTRKFSTLLTKTGCSHSGFIGVFDASICSYIACASSYLNSRHNTVTSNSSLATDFTQRSVQNSASLMLEWSNVPGSHCSEKLSIIIGSVLREEVTIDWKEVVYSFQKTSKPVSHSRDSICTGPISTPFAQFINLIVLPPGAQTCGCL